MLVVFLSFSISEFANGDTISPFVSSLEIKYPCIEGDNVARFEVQHFCMFAEGDKCLLDTSHFACLEILYLCMFAKGEKCLLDACM